MPIYVCVRYVHAAQPLTSSVCGIKLIIYELIIFIILYWLWCDHVCFFLFASRLQFAKVGGLVQGRPLTKTSYRHTRDIRSPHIFAYWSQIGDDTMTMQYAEGIQVCQLHCIVIAAWGKNHARHRLHLPQSKWTKSSVWMRMQRSICCECLSIQLIWLLLSCIFPHTRSGAELNRLCLFAYFVLWRRRTVHRSQKYSVRHTHWIRTRLVDCYSI